MKQILVNILEDTDDIRRFVDGGIGYAEIAKTHKAVIKRMALDARIVDAPFMCLPSQAKHTMLAIGKRIWAVGEDGAHPEEIAFLGEHSLLTKDGLREYKYNDYRYKWFDAISEALDMVAAKTGCDMDDVVEGADGIWRAPKKEQATEGGVSPFAIKANSVE